MLVDTEFPIKWVTIVLDFEFTYIFQKHIHLYTKLPLLKLDIEI